MKTRHIYMMMLGLMISFSLILSGCSGKGVSGLFGFGKSKSNTTVISGKVSLSGSLSSKPNMATLSSAPVGMPGTRKYQSSEIPVEGLSTTLNASQQKSALSGAVVDLYDANHPEWLYPVSTGSCDDNGDYELSSMTNVEYNQTTAYKEGDPIPAGNYTLVAHKEKFGERPLVAVQSIVNSFSGNVSGLMFEILPSDVSPVVSTMFGVAKNTNGTMTWGNLNQAKGAVTALAPNDAIQITFSMPMLRETLDAVVVSPRVSGKWTLSADWLTATYYLDPGASMTPDTVYTVTIYGNDDTGAHAQVANVYGNAIDHTSVGTFKTSSSADTMSPSLQWNRPTVAEMGDKIDCAEIPFRIESTELLDVNGITLEGVASKKDADGNPVTIGVKPGVLYLGKNNTGLYVYEFVLGQPLMLDTTYNLTVKDGKDLAGNPMGNLPGKITTKNAAQTPGIDPNASEATQNLQAQVKTVFAKWVRALNDRNLAQFQNVMNGDFVMEYGAAIHGTDVTNDVNRDGKYSFSEFSKMIATSFAGWDYCGTSITGAISPTLGMHINLNPLDNTADFEFTLTSTNLINSQECTDAAPQGTLYATVKYQNSAWRIIRASQDIDTRNKSLIISNFIPATLTQYTGNIAPDARDISDGAKLDAVPDTPSTPVPQGIYAEFAWDAVPGVESYVLVLVDAREPWRGRAVAFPKTVLKAKTTDNWNEDLYKGGLGGRDVSAQFGLKGTGSAEYVIGGRYYWEVIGFGTTAFDAISTKQAFELLKDITAVSTVKNFGIAGQYPELRVQVRAGSLASSAPISYSEIIGGYDVGSAFRAHLTIETGNKGVMNGDVTVWGSSATNYPLLFDAVTGVATQTVVLYKGINMLSSCDAGSATQTRLCKKFTIVTTKGLAPEIEVWDVSDDTGNTIIGDATNFFTATVGAKKATISGGVSDPNVGAVTLSLINPHLGADSVVPALVTTDAGGNRVYTADVDIYNGINWITITGNSGAPKYIDYRTGLGISAPTGKAWIPPIEITSVADVSTDSTPGLADKTADYGTSSDWTAAVGASSTVKINGKFKVASQGKYSTWCNGQNLQGAVTTAGDGTFGVIIPVFYGWNAVTILDFNGKAYTLNIYTETAKKFIPLKITAIDGKPYYAPSDGTFGEYSTTGCSVTITGTASPDKTPVLVWQGSDGSNGRLFEPIFLSPDSSGNFTGTLPLVNTESGGTNEIILENLSDNSMSALSVNSSGACTYTPADIVVTSIKSSSGTVLFADPVSGNSYDVAGNTTMSISGTSSKPGQSIYVYTRDTGAMEMYSGYASSTPNGSGTYDWTISGIKVYSVNAWFSVQDIYAYYIAGSTNGRPLPPPVFSLTDVNPIGGTMVCTPDPNGEPYANCTGSASAVAPVFSTTLTSGIVMYSDDYNSYSMAIDGTGTIQLPQMDLYQGGNYLRINVGMGSYYTLYINSSTTNLRPKIVEITSPTMNQVVSTGTVTVTGTTNAAGLSNWNPNYVNAYTYDYYTGISNYYSTDAFEQQNYGYLPLILVDDMFIFSASLTPGYMSYISVYASDRYSPMGGYHYHTIYVNSVGFPDTNFGKPGAVNTAAAKTAALKRGLEVRSTETFLRNINPWR